MANRHERRRLRAVRNPHGSGTQQPEPPPKQTEVEQLRASVQQLQTLLIALVRRDGRARLRRSELDAVVGKPWQMRVRPEEDGSVVVEVSAGEAQPRVAVPDMQPPPGIVPA